MGKVNESEAKAIVVKYLTNQNRPYSVNDLVANLHNEVPKALMQKTLDGLVEESKIKEKVNGKQKVNLSHSFRYTRLQNITSFEVIALILCQFVCLKEKQFPENPGNSFF